MHPKEVVEFIKSEELSYSELASAIYKKFGVRVGKSLISYYKRSRTRIKQIYLDRLSEWELEWLLGLYYADGCKFKEKHQYTIKFGLDHSRDKDISQRVIELLQKIGLKPTISLYRGSTVIRVYSKILHDEFPPKDGTYRPKEIFAFLSGLIDGDGSIRKGKTGVIWQYHYEDLMSYLVDECKLTKHYSVRVRWGKLSKGIFYYVPLSVCKILKDKNYCIKLLRHVN